jgi:hypothetical protein
MIKINMQGRKIVTVVNATAILLVTWGFIIVSYAGEPGSAEDPIVTESLLDSKVTELSNQINQLKQKNVELTTLYSEFEKSKTDVEKLKTEFEKLKVKVDEFSKLSNDFPLLKAKVDAMEKKSIEDVYGKFGIVQLKVNQEVILGESTEMVLRAGKAKVIASNSGGLADLTDDKGSELKSDANVPLNHLLIASRQDGRGFKVRSEEVWVLIKGKYEIR